jgi:hypothetical protein
MYLTMSSQNVGSLAHSCHKSLVSCSGPHLCDERGARTPLWLNICLDVLFEEPTGKPDSTRVEQNEQSREHHTGYIQHRHGNNPPDPVEDGNGNWQG